MQSSSLIQTTRSKWKLRQIKAHLLQAESSLFASRLLTKESVYPLKILKTCSCPISKQPMI